MKRSLETLARGLATVAGLGERLPAAGTTVGSLAALLSWWLMCATVPSPTARLLTTAAATVAAALVGIWASESEVRRLHRKDPQSVVIDEVAGQWLTFLVAMPLAGQLSGGALLGFGALGFALFRVFDVVKPWPLRRLEAFPGGIGVMADDLAAGYYAAISLIVIWSLVT